MPWHLPFHRAGTILSGGNQDKTGSMGVEHEAGAGDGEGRVIEDSEGIEEVAGDVCGARMAAELYEVDSAKRTVRFMRYYHLFEELELRQVVEAAGPHVRILGSEYDKSNWVVRFKLVV